MLESLEGRRVLAFTTPISFPVGSNPAGIAVGDFNSDGRDDMAVVNTGIAGSVSVLLSSADGAFLPRVDYPAGTNAFDATAGDLNGDGKLDLVVVGTAVDILMGNGDGTFAAAVEFPVTPSAHSVKVGDFNKDGKLDVGTMNVNSASVLLGNGDGSLQTPMVANVPGNNINLVVGDYDRDGNLDMATSNTNSVGTINVLKGHGDGTFEPYSSYYAFSAPVYLASGDFNNDGYIDFACPNSYVATSMSVLINKGDGTYGAPHTYGISQTGYEIEVEDFNNDGFDDFAVRGGSKYMVSHGKGDGTFYPSVDFATPSGRFEAGTHGDFNGDGAIDLAYPSTNGVTVVTNDNADYQNLAGAVTFRLTAPATTTSGSVLPMTITAIDANGDIATGFRGMVYISSSDPQASTASGYAFNPLDAGIPYLFTAADSGTHAFTGAIRLVTGGDQSVTVSAPNMTPASVTVNVTGQVTKLAFTVPSSTTAGDTFNITVSAIDSTGSIAPGYSSKVHFSSSDAIAGLPADYTFTPEDLGSHTFAVTLKSSGARSVSAIEVGGKIGGSATVNVAPQVASSFVLAGGAGAIGVSRPITVVARDTFGNIATGYSGTVHFTSTDPSAVLPSDTTLVNGAVTVNVKFLTVGTQVITATDNFDPTLFGSVTSDATPPIAKSFLVTGYPNTIAGSSNSFTVSVIDTIGQIASGYTGTIYFSSSDLKAGLPTSYTFTAADAGVHSFSATMKSAGLQTLSVRDSTGGLTGAQSGIEVAAAEFASFQLTVPNGADSKGHILVAAGDNIALKVKAIDLYGNQVSNYTGTVGFTSTDATAFLPANYTFTPEDAGSHVFHVELRTATPNGVVYTISVADTLDATTVANITNFEVTNSVAASFVVTLPANMEAGVEFVSKVTARDAYGNVVKNYFGTVHFDTSSALSGLPADYTYDSSDAGVHDFLVTLNTSGIQILTVSDASDASVLGSETGSVKSSVATQFSVESASSTVAGDSLILTVAARDAFGNISVDYRGSVVFSSSDSTASLPASYTFSNNDAGLHVFSVALKKSGTQSLTVSDSVDRSIVGSRAGVTVLPSSVAGSFVLTGPNSATAGTSQSITVKVKDLFGNLTDSYTGTVIFSSSDIQAGLPATYTFTAADAGEHTFSLILKTAGKQSISIRDSSNSQVSGALDGINVVAAPAAASVRVIGYPATVAGTSKSFTVEARDAFGNICRNYTGTVVFSSSDSQAGLPSAYTFTAEDAGSHVFSATLKTAGTQAISVSDVNSSNLVATQSGILVSAGAATRFALSAPSSVTSGVGFKVTVTAFDAFGNRATDYLGKVQITSSDPKSGSSKYGFSSRDGGVATLSYSLNTLGLQTIKVVDLANSSIVSTLAVTVVSKK